MNIYEKLQLMRVALQGMNLKKSGKNTYAGYEYFELGDFMPPINKLMADHKVCSVVVYGEDMAYLTLINSENPEEKIQFTSPMKEATLKGAHAIQNLGAVETYQRRYLYMTAFEIVEADALDATQGADNRSDAQNRRNASTNKPTHFQPKAAQKPAVSPTAAKKQNEALPDELSALLNSKIKEAKQASGLSVADVVEALERNTGIKMADVTVETSQTILAELDSIINAGAALPF